MPLVRALPFHGRGQRMLSEAHDQGLSPNQGRSPEREMHVTARRSRRLTSGGKAVLKRRRRIEEIYKARTEENLR